MNEYSYRRATHSDVNQLQQLCLLSFGQYKSIISNDNWQTWSMNFNDDTTYNGLLKVASCFICETENKIIGMAFLIPSGNPFLFFETEWSYIRLVAVHPGYEGKGIGKKLTRQCIDLAKESGEKMIALHTSEFQHAARHMYERAGFKKKREFELFGKKYWIYILQLN